MVIDVHILSRRMLALRTGFISEAFLSVLCSWVGEWVEAMWGEEGGKQALNSHINARSTDRGIEDVAKCINTINYT